MKALKILTLSLLGILFVLLVVFGIMCYSIYNQVKTDTIPNIEVTNFEGYEINIVNSIIENRELEIPPEILSGVISEQLNKDVVCTIENKNIVVYFKENIEMLGECSISANFENIFLTDNMITIDIGDIFVGTYKIPTYFYKYLNVPFEKETIEFELEPYYINFLGFEFEFAIDSLSVRDDEIYCTFETNFNTNGLFAKDDDE